MTDLLSGKRLAQRPRVIGSLALLGVAALAAVWFVTRPPFKQDVCYHCFADQRSLFGLPHCLNVISNLPFLVVGALGLGFLRSRAALRSGGPFRQPAERWPFWLFFLGVALTSLGSSYYHLDPNNDRLLWDRLPMAVAFMALFAGVWADRVSLRIALGLLPVLVAAGLASVLYWHWSEQRGQGDLRPYYVVQFGSMLALPVLLLLFPAYYSGTLYLVTALGCYVAAKFFENPLDARIFAWGNWVSGHTLKHLAAALAAYCVLRWAQRRVPVGREELFAENDLRR